MPHRNASTLTPTAFTACNQGPRTVELVVDVDSTQRLDVWLAERFPEMSRARLQALIRAGNVMVDSRVLREHRRVKAGQRILLTVPAPVPTRLQPQNLPLNIVYQDADIVVVNKSPGMVVHPAPGHADGTLVNALLYHCPDLAGIGDELRPGIVHRLDRDTSGLIVAAKTEVALRHLARQFRERLVCKEYLALVRGNPSTRGRVDAAIARHRVHRKKMAPHIGGRAAQTSFIRLACYRDAALLRLCIYTGRTHQIRVHMAHLGHPVLGDRLYGRGARTAHPGKPWLAVPRQMLHAARLKFTHPVTQAPLDFICHIPEDMRSVIASLKL